MFRNKGYIGDIISLEFGWRRLYVHLPSRAKFETLKRLVVEYRYR
jgi:hypothetical protein